MKGTRNIEKLIKARDELLSMADAIQGIIDGDMSQSDAAEAHGMTANDFSRNLSARFAPYIKKRLIAVKDLPAMVNATFGPADRMLCDILGIQPDDNALTVLPEFDREALLLTAKTTLTPRESIAMELKYGYGRADRPYSLKEIGREFYVTEERARQICAKAVRKMRHPSRVRKIYPMLSENGEYHTGIAVTVMRDASNTLARALDDMDKAKRMESAAADVTAGKCPPERIEEANEMACRKDGVRFADPAHLPIEEMDLSVRAYTCLKRAGLDTAKDVLDAGVDGLMRVRNLGRKSMDEVIDKIESLTGKKPA